MRSFGERSCAHGVEFVAVSIISANGQRRGGRDRSESRRGRHSRAAASINGCDGELGLDGEDSREGENGGVLHPEAAAGLEEAM